MKLSEVGNILKAEVLLGQDRMDTTVILGGCGTDTMDDILSAVAKGSVLLTGVVTEQVIQTAKIAEVGAIVFVRGKRPNPRVLDLAEAFNMPVLRTTYSMFVACGRLYMNGLRGLDGSW